MILLVGAMIFDHEGDRNALEGHDDDDDHHDEGHCDAVVSHLGDGDHDNDDEGDRDAVVGHPLVGHPCVPAVAPVHRTTGDQHLCSSR